MSRFFMVTAVLGVAVLASYVHGVTGHPELVARDALWGSMPAWLKSVYETYMFVAAAAFFPGFVTFLRNPDARYFGRSRAVVEALYVALLVPSTLWIGMAFAYLEAPTAALWWLMRIDLFVVAAAAVAMVAALVSMTPRPAPVALRAAIVGQVLFCVQTALLDPLVWPLFVRAH